MPHARYTSTVASHHPSTSSSAAGVSSLLGRNSLTGRSTELISTSSAANDALDRDAATIAIAATY